jgi:nucleoside-diphosphate-sugar epimerase
LLLNRIRLQDRDIRVAVFGTGGVGGYFGGRLAEAGEDVIFIARGDHLRAIKEKGLKVDSPDGDFVIYPAKAWQVPEAARAMRPLVGANTTVLPLQTASTRSSSSSMRSVLKASSVDFAGSSVCRRAWSYSARWFHAFFHTFRYYRRTRQQTIPTHRHD